MPEIIISKICSQCKHNKPLSNFGRDCTKVDGHSTVCKACRCNYQKQYRTTPNGKEVHRLSVHRHNHTDKGKACKRRYAQSGKGKLARKHIDANRLITCPEKLRAKNAVTIACKQGRLPRIKSLYCFCSKPAQHYHHFCGYSLRHYLTVIALCALCHKRIHALRLMA